MGSGECVELSEREYDLVLLDLKMVGIDGIDVLKTVKRDAGYDRNLLTGHGSLRSAINALRLGAQDYIPETSYYQRNPEQCLKRIGETC
jgi:two-component system response regulator HydG